MLNPNQIHLLRLPRNKLNSKVNWVLKLLQKIHYYIGTPNLKSIFAIPYVSVLVSLRCQRHMPWIQWSWLWCLESTISILLHSKHGKYKTWNNGRCLRTGWITKNFYVYLYLDSRTMMVRMILISAHIISICCHGRSP